jgi:hypothetical protein
MEILIFIAFAMLLAPYVLMGVATLKVITEYNQFHKKSK